MAAAVAATPTFDEIYRAHWRALKCYCSRLLNCTTKGQDAAQEAFLRTFRTGRAFETLRDAERYLYRAACNVCRNLIRQERAAERRDMRERGASGAVVDTIELRLLMLELMNQLVMACGAVDMATVEMVLVDELDQESVASAVGCTRRTVSNRLRRVRMAAQRLEALN